MTWYISWKQIIRWAVWIILRLNYLLLLAKLASCRIYVLLVGAISTLPGRSLGQQCKEEKGKKKEGRCMTSRCPTRAPVPWSHSSSERTARHGGFSALLGILWCLRAQPCFFGSLCKCIHFYFPQNLWAIIHTW